MSFGFAIGDFVALGRLAWGLYKQCKSASAEFADLCNDILSVHTALRELEDEAQNEDSILNRAGKSRQKELNNIVQNCTEVLRQLEALVTRYRSLGTSQKKVWDRIKFGDEGIQVIRNKLVLHTSTLTLFLTSLGTGSLGRIEKKLDDIAAEVRAGRHEPSVITAVNDGTGSSQSEGWRFLCGELAEEFSRDEIEAYKEEIKAYIKHLTDQGALEEQEHSVHSEEGATHSSSPRPSSPSATDLASGTSSPTITGHPDSSWPPRPTAVSVSGSDSPDHPVSPLQRELRPETQRMFNTANQSSTRRAGSPHYTAAANSQNQLNEVLSTHQDDSFLDEVETKVRHSNRWGVRCFISIEIGHDCCRVAAYDFILRKLVSIPDETGVVDMPTCIAFTEEELLVGSAAKQQAAKNLENTFSGFTCLLGRGCDGWDAAQLEYKWYECGGLRRRGTDLMIFVPCRKRHYTLVELTGILLQRCKHLAETHCGGIPESSYIAICSWSLVAEAMAAAAEIGGIPAPKIFSSDLTLAWSVATERRLDTGLDKTSIMVVDATTRGCSVSAVSILGSLRESCELHAGRREHAIFGASIDQIYARDQVHQRFGGIKGDGFIRVVSNPLMRHVKHIGILIESVRKDLIRSGEASRYIPVLGSDKNFVLMSTRVGTSRIVFSEYLEILKEQLEMLCDSKRMPDICILTGEVACLKPVQSLIQRFFAESGCHLVLAATNEAISSSRGAVDLALRSITIRETMPRRLELHLSDDEGKDRFLSLGHQLKRGQDLNPWVKSVRLFPVSTAERGLYIAIYGTGNMSEDPPTRQLLFEVAIEQTYGNDKFSGLGYSLEVSVDQEYNIDFELRCPHGFRSGYMVTAHVHCSNAGVVDLHEGAFVGVDNYKRQNWRLKSSCE